MKTENYYGQYYWTHRPKGFCIRAMWTLYVVDFFLFFQCTDTFKQMCKEAWQKLSARKNLQKEKMFDAAKPHGNIFPIWAGKHQRVFPNTQFILSICPFSTRFNQNLSCQNNKLLHLDAYFFGECHFFKYTTDGNDNLSVANNDDIIVCEQWFGNVFLLLFTW